jgi:predicted nucleic acid-binding protein
MKTKLYLDTSVPSAYYDTSKPIRQLITQKWFENESSVFELYTSVVAIEEIEKISNPEKKENIKRLLIAHDVHILELSESAVKISQKYMEEGAIPASEPEDALHIAICTVQGIESLASWNFKHIVNINPIKKIRAINLKNNFKIVEIGSLEIFGGYKYGNL